MPYETFLEMLYRVVIDGNASPTESFRIMCSLAIVVFSALALTMMYSNYKVNQREREYRRNKTHVMMTRYFDV